MIVMRLRGRLGNQLFIYAFGRALQEQYHQPLVLLDNVNDTGGTVLSELNIPKQVKIVPYQSGYKFDYYHMNASDYGKIRRDMFEGIRKEKDVRKFCNRNSIPVMDTKQTGKYITYKLKNKRKTYRERFEWETQNVESLAQAGLLICENGYIQFPKTDAENIFAFGYFQSERYFTDIKDSIRKEVLPKNIQISNLNNFVDEIQNSNSVCVNIRMGDYVNNPIMGVCTTAYYQRAIDEICNLYHDAKLFVFSNDVEMVKRTFRFQKEVIFEPEGISALETLKYMSMCRNFIISNSSFAWWAQYLGECSEKIVIAPERWYANDIPCEIQQRNWIFLPT